MEDARLETNVEHRVELYQQAEEIIVMDAPWVALWHSVNYMLTKPDVHGAVYAASIFPWLRHVYIEQ